MKEFFLKVWNAMKWVLKQLWAAISDQEWDLDVYRLGGLAAYVIAGKIALDVMAQLAILDATKLGIGAGLASAIAGIGTSLFVQARKSDDTTKYR
jgi:hypothetical protein